MYHAGLFIVSGITYYTAALVSNMRADITWNCEESILRDLLGFGKFGKLMIKKGWIEMPPFANDRSSTD